MSSVVGLMIAVATSGHAQGAAEQAPRPAAPSSSGSSAPGAAAAPAPSGPVGGYSWSEKRKPVKRKVARRRTKRQHYSAQATYPGFRVLPNGQSELVLRLSNKVNVQMRQANGAYSFVLPGVHVGVRNNTNPLITTHFDTPLARARLSQRDDGAELLLELREAVTPSFKTMTAEGGAMILLITLPRPARSYSDGAAEIRPDGALPP